MLRSAWITFLKLHTSTGVEFNILQTKIILDNDPCFIQFSCINYILNNRWQITFQLSENCWQIGLWYPSPESLESQFFTPSIKHAEHKLHLQIIYISFYSYFYQFVKCVCVVWMMFVSIHKVWLNWSDGLESWVKHMVISAAMNSIIGKIKSPYICIYQRQLLCEADKPPKLTHCGLMMPYGITELGQHWFR